MTKIPPKKYKIDPTFFPPKNTKKGLKKNGFFFVFLGLFLFFWEDFCFTWGIYVLFVFFGGIFCIFGGLF
jgi:hypothetical protein